MRHFLKVHPLSLLWIYLLVFNLSGFFLSQNLASVFTHYIFILYIHIHILRFLLLPSLPNSSSSPLYISGSYLNLKTQTPQHTRRVTHLPWTAARVQVANCFFLWYKFSLHSVPTSPAPCPQTWITFHSSPFACKGSLHRAVVEWV